MEKQLTTVRITKRELTRLIELATTRKRKVVTKRNGDVDNIYVDDEIFAESMKGYCNLIIRL